MVDSRSQADMVEEEVGEMLLSGASSKTCHAAGFGGNVIGVGSKQQRDGAVEQRKAEKKRIRLTFDRRWNWL